MGISRRLLLAVVRALSGCPVQNQTPEWTPAADDWTPAMRRLTYTAVETLLKKPPSQTSI